MELHCKYPNKDDQILLNMAIKSENKKLKINILNRNEFYNGLDFFEKQHIFFNYQFKCIYNYYIKVINVIQFIIIGLLDLLQKNID